MPFQKAVYVLGKLSPNSFGGRDFFDAGFSQSADGSKFSQKQVLPVLTDAGAIVENALSDSFFHQELMIGVCKTVRFVADSLEKAQGARLERQLQWKRPPGPINFFVLLREADDRKIMQSETLKFAAGRRELAFAAIDDD